MDIATLLGLFLGVGVVIAAVLEGSDFWVFINFPGFLIVICGTFAATLIKFPISTVFIAFGIGTKAAFGGGGEDKPKDIIQLALELAEATRKGGVLALEKVEITNTFFEKGIKLCVDGYADDVREKALKSDMELSIQRHEEGAKIFRGIGESAPAFGMIGTLVGLVQMLSGLDDPKTIGPAMAVALLTTLYGALIANLVALPIADKLETKTEYERVTKTLIIDAVGAIQKGHPPSVIEELLTVYLSDSELAKRRSERASEDKE
jgi:chemotaxis protein MotA